MEKNNDRPRYMIANDEMKRNITDVSSRIMTLFQGSPECDPTKPWGVETAVQALLMSLAAVFHSQLRKRSDPGLRRLQREKILREVPMSLDLNLSFFEKHENEEEG